MSAPPSLIRKRKRGDDRLLLGSPFVVQPHVACSFDVSTKVSPTVILPRSHIPVNWLAGAPSRIFNTPAENSALCASGYVTIVKIEGERQLSALEKVGDNVYTLYRLSTQLRMKDIRKVAAQTKNSPYMEIGEGTYNVCEQDWWSGIGSAEYPFQDTPVTDAALDMGVRESDMAEHAARDSSNPAKTPLVPDPLPEDDDHQDPAVQQNIQPTMSEVLEQVQRQYFDTLYLAKTSLAYFAKSTLSRARAICHDIEVTPPASRFDELTEFLRRMILPLDKMDLKYRKSLVQIAQEHEVDDPSVFRPDEDGYIQRWRQSAFQERFIRETDTELKQKLEELRIRETELQIILLLEILALNKQHPPAAPTTLESPKGKGKSKKEKKKKTKKNKGVNKAPDPDVLLDLLVDRLCIWHSIGSETARDGVDTPAKGKDIVSEKDHLRHFSVEVIMAFYSSKLPEKCASINKKFGGRSAPSTASASVFRQTKPFKNSRVVVKKAPGLSRTDTALSAGSRGTTTESLALLASEGAAAPRAIRGGTLNSKSFTKKIVQMNVQKKADEELKNVIQALAKPNRAAAATELVDDAEKRLAKSVRRSRKAKASPSDVHVAATPQKRNKDIFAESFKDSRASVHHHQAPSSRLAPSEVAATPPSRHAFKPSHFDDSVVLATPRKGLFAELQRFSVHRPKTLPRSAPAAAVGDKDATIFATPVKKRQGQLSVPGFWSPVAAGGVPVAKDTPLKKAPIASIYDALGWDE